MIGKPTLSGEHRICGELPAREGRTVPRTGTAAPPTQCGGRQLKNVRMHCPHPLHGRNECRGRARSGSVANFGVMVYEAA